MAVPIQPTYSGSLEVQAQKGSPDIRKLMFTETADERPGADADDGFATTESGLTVYAGDAAEKETLAGNGIVMARAGSTARVVPRAGSTAREQAARSEQPKGSCKAYW